ncbi:MAG: ATP12 family protein [Pseudomonadota bacterium]|nr:ATP12 family protein [Pseudomonadota bacterium]
MRELFEESGKSKPSDNPMETARGAVRPVLPRRFYKQAGAGAVDGGYGVQLDGRPVKTPGRKLLAFEQESIAQFVAAEWQAQGDVIDPATMPATRLVNTALDGVANDPQAVMEDILAYAASDLLCYRAGSPQGLVDRQIELWDPVIDWLRDEIGANFVLGEGVVPVTQPRDAVAAFSARLRLHGGVLKTACLHTFTTLTGSAFLALAIAERQVTAEHAWEAAHVDEDWNISLWGEDGEAAARRKLRWLKMKAAAEIFALAG